MSTAWPWRTVWECLVLEGVPRSPTDESQEGFPDDYVDYCLAACRLPGSRTELTAVVHEVMMMSTPLSDSLIPELDQLLNGEQTLDESSILPSLSTATLTVFRATVVRGLGGIVDPLEAIAVLIDLARRQADMPSDVVGDLLSTEDDYSQPWFTAEPLSARQSDASDRLSQFKHRLADWVGDDV